MTDNRENVSAWIEYLIESWLYKLQPTAMRDSCEIINSQLNAAIKKSDFSAGWNLIERLEHLSKSGHEALGASLHKRDYAETQLMCGVGAFKMGEYKRAKVFLNTSLGLYSPLGHYRGVVLWILGCIQWLLVSEVDDALLSWEQAKSIFSNQKDPPHMTAWYAQKTDEMRIAIEIATKENCPPHPDRVIKLASAKDKTTATGKFKPPTKHLIHSLPVLGQISAGKMYNGINPDCELEIREVFFCDDTPYFPINLRSSGNIIKIPQGIEHYVLKVTGNSMNATSPVPILDGDYVLMRAQNTADNSDIVAAEIVGLDDRATLKRYKRENGKHILMPESDDPAFQTPISVRREFTKLDNEFFIRGIVLAVLRRVED